MSNVVMTVFVVTSVTIALQIGVKCGLSNVHVHISNAHLHMYNRSYNMNILDYACIMHD